MKKNNSAFMAVLTVMIVIGCFVFTWKFILPGYTQKQQEIAQIDLEIKNAQAKYDSLTETKAALSQLGDLVNQMLVAVPSDKDTPNLITELEAIAAKNDATIPSISIADSSSSESATSAASGVASSSNAITVSFAVCGSFDGMHTMISSLESDLRFMNVQSITLTQEAASSSPVSGSDTCSGKLSLAIQLLAYKRVDVGSSLFSTQEAVPGS